MAEFIINEFTNEGIETVENFLKKNLKLIGKGRRSMYYLPEETGLPKHFLHDKELVREFDPNAKKIDESKKLKNNHDLGCYINYLLKDCDKTKIEASSGLWSWLGVFYLGIVCPLERGKGYRTGDMERWVLSASTKKTGEDFYRHMIRHPYRFVRDMGEKYSKVFIKKPLGVLGDSVEQTAGSQEFYWNKNFSKVVYKLYFSENSETVKKGISGTSGGLRRLKKVYNQLGVNWDLFTLNPDKTIKMLKDGYPEFHIFIDD